ncbi:MAG: hypothetical protein DI551_07925, partial [Micavibrio aeruginosavorus]
MAAYFLFAAIVVYALAGSPTPDHPGIIEAVVGGLLLLSLAAAGLHRAVDFNFSGSGYLKALQAFFLTGLVLPSLAGAYLGNDHWLIVRDVLAFAFLGLPLFLTRIFQESMRATEILCRLYVFAGLAFAVRTLMPAFNIWIPQGELLYLSNSPLALFAAVF